MCLPSLASSRNICFVREVKSWLAHNVYFKTHHSFERTVNPALLAFETSNGVIPLPLSTFAAL
jgi:hypothetical protein